LYFLVHFHALIGLFPLNKGILLVDGCTLLLFRGSLALSLFAPFLASAVFWSSSINLLLGGFFSLLLEFLKRLRVGLQLTVDSVNVLLSAAELATNLTENLANLTERVNLANIVAISSKESSS
jgi:hypothetical protein